MRYVPKPVYTPSHDYVKRKHGRLKERCFDKGMAFDMSYDDVRKLLCAKTCYFTGIRLVSGEGTKPKSGDVTPYNLLTIDRLDCTKGYIKGNVVACCYEFNCMKGSLEGVACHLTPKQFVKALRKLADLEESTHE